MNDRTMPPLNSQSQPLDTRLIELERTGEMEYWLKVFETSQDELLAAMSEVGPSAGAVAKFLRSRA